MLGYTKIRKDMPMKKQKRKRYLGIGLLCLFLLGCAKEKIVIETEERIAVETDDGEDTTSREETIPVLEESESQPGEEAALEENKTVWVHICGEVLQPGVYELPVGARIWDALLEAGGVTDQAAADYLNQASLLEDGMKITVPSRKQAEQWETNGETGVQKSGPRQGASGVGAEGQEAGEQSGKVNLNTADETTLCTLPGIGASRAKSIIAYREKNGPFTQIEDIMKVTGIKEAAFAKIKDYICVS